MTRCYLDYNATCPPRPEVIEAVARAMRLEGNSSSVHAEGRAAHEAVEDAREQARTFLNAPANGIIFTSGGTESIHYALNGTVKNGVVKRIFLSAIEHAAVRANAEAAGVPVETVPALSAGLVDLDWLKDRLADYDVKREGGVLVCVMYANNETGAIQPVSAAADIVHEAGGIFFVDAAQAVGKIPVDFARSGADMMAFTGHKFGGPLGVGALIARENLPLEPVMRGGGHEMNRRAGTHNVPAIAGLGVACDLAIDSIEQAGAIAGMRDRMEKAAVEAGAKIWGAEAERLPGTLCLSAEGFSGATQLMAMDLAGIAVSAGSACSSGKTKPSHVLEALGASEIEATSAIRVSLGWNSSEEDAEAFIREWPAAYARVKERAA
ncbi:MAG: cysteine desulfurase family protein [Parvularculaceae bacterium]